MPAVGPVLTCPECGREAASCAHPMRTNSPRPLPGMCLSCRALLLAEQFLGPQGGTFRTRPADPGEWAAALREHNGPKAETVEVRWATAGLGDVVLTSTVVMALEGQKRVVLDLPPRYSDVADLLPDSRHEPADDSAEPRDLSGLWRMDMWPVRQVVGPALLLNMMVGVAPWEATERGSDKPLLRPLPEAVAEAIADKWFGEGLNIVVAAWSAHDSRLDFGHEFEVAEALRDLADDVAQVWLASSPRTAPKVRGSKNATGKLKPIEVVALVQQADLVVTCDTGILHVAQALRRPTLLLCASVPWQSRAEGYEKLVAWQDLSACPRERCDGQCEKECTAGAPIAQLAGELLGAQVGASS